METQYGLIAELARTYSRYASEQTVLFAAINALDPDELQVIYDEYIPADADFKPVNLLRAQVARLLISGERVDNNTVNEIKQRIRTKDKAYFSHSPSGVLLGLSEYVEGGRDVFANWQKLWGVFHVYFYRGKVKETVQVYLKQMCEGLLGELQLSDYDYHWVDFYGASNFGSDRCWLALFPAQKQSHKEAYQFFVEMGGQPVAGRKAGYDLKNPNPNQLQSVSTYLDVIDVLTSLKADIVGLNQRLRNYFKFSPGSQALDWDHFKDTGIAGLSFSDLQTGDLTELSTLTQINLAAGLAEDNNSNKTWNLWLFRTAKIGDVVFANKGTNTCLGIGIIEGGYYYDGDDSIYRHKRKVNWIVDKLYHYKGTLKTNKTLFRPDTFSPTRISSFLIDEYLRLYPELSGVFAEYNLSSPKSESTQVVEVSVQEETFDRVERSLNFWWLNSNPEIWSISSYNEGDRQTYTSRNEKGNKRRIYKYFEAAQPGDLVIGYESSPIKQIKAIYEITKALHQSEQEGEVIEFEILEKFDVPVSWEDIKDIPALARCEVLQNNQGSLFKLTEEEFDILRDVVDSRNIEYERIGANRKVVSYDFSADEDRPFINADRFHQAVRLLARKKNIILQGPPGVGKTFIARKIAYQLLSEVNNAQIEMIQFHQSYSYEDFIQGLRPGKHGFEVKSGIFYNFCKRALTHPDRKFFFVIDEINRGNLSKIFGELLMLIEHDKRGPENSMPLTYAEGEIDKFHVPENVYIIGTMNTADRSLAIVDYALRRRFAFISLQPEYGREFRNFLLDRRMSPEMVEKICNSVIRVNEKIKGDINLGDGFLIGHSYFCSFNQGEDENVWWKEVLEFELRPLLEEIWFDDLDRAAETISILT